MSFEKFVEAIYTDTASLYNVRHIFKPEYLEQPYKGMRPIHLACWKNYNEIISFLIDRGCDLNAPDQGGWRPIHISSFWGNKEIIQLLIRHGCQIDCCTHEMKSPIDYAEKQKQKECVDILRKALAERQGSHADLTGSCVVIDSATSDVLQREADLVLENPQENSADKLHPQNSVDSLQVVLSSIFREANQLKVLKDWFSDKSLIPQGTLSRCQSFDSIFYEISKTGQYASLLEFLQNGKSHGNDLEIDAAMKCWELIKSLGTECSECKMLSFNKQFSSSENGFPL